MALGEFDIIRQHFMKELGAFGVALGIGDDCALLRVPSNDQLAVSMDTLVAGVHFPKNADPELIAQRALRVNLSDLAAMGARPLWFTLGLTLPKPDNPWLEGFSSGLFKVANEYDCALVGGDTTRGPLSITIQVHGSVDGEKALLRSNARPGDVVFATGKVGDGAAALAVLKKQLDVGTSAFDYFMNQYYFPTPRIKEGLLLSGIASAAIDISDGLVADLGHICEQSGTGAMVDVKRLPISDAVKKLAKAPQILKWALSGGDDYQLCFTVPKNRLARLEPLIEQGKIDATVVGEIVKGSGVTCLLDGKEIPVQVSGYQHFEDGNT